MFQLKSEIACAQVHEEAPAGTDASFSVRQKEGRIGYGTLSEKCEVPDRFL
jgi:hypothetical protein